MKALTVLVILLAVLSFAACSGKSASLDTPAAVDDLPAPATLSWFSRAAIDGFMRFSASTGSRSGYIALFARDGVPIYSNAAGWKDIESKEVMTMETPVRIASMTKPITAVVAMSLVEQGKMQLDDPVAKYLPEFSNTRVATSHSLSEDGSVSSAPANNELLIKHLFMFSSGIGPGSEDGSDLFALWDEQGIYRQVNGALGDRVRAMAKLPLFEEPGTRWRYGFSADVLARVVEVVSGKPYANYLAETVLQPLGMQHTHHLRPAGQRDELATVYTQDENGNLVATIPDHDGTWTPGGGGMVSTAADYMRFALMLWNDGEYQGTRILSAKSIQNMQALHVPGGVLTTEGIDGMGWGLGMAVVADAEQTITPDRDGDFWWAGYLGTSFFVSPSTGLVGVILTQNAPGPHSGDPVGVYIIQALAFAGL